MRYLKQLTAAAACTALVGLGAPAALAQQQSQDQQYQQQGQQQAPGSAQQATSVSDSDLALYVKATKKIESVRQDLEADMQQAESREEAMNMQTEAQQTMVDAVRSFGLTVEEYNQIAQVVRNDEETREKVEEMLQ